MMTLICQECFSNIGIEQRAYKWQTNNIKYMKANSMSIEGRIAFYEVEVCVGWHSVFVLCNSGM